MRIDQNILYSMEDLLYRIFYGDGSGRWQDAGQIARAPAMPLDGAFINGVRIIG